MDFLENESFIYWTFGKLKFHTIVLALNMGTLRYLLDEIVEIG